MVIKKINYRGAFTLLEIILSIVAIGILAAITLVAINPNKQLSQVRNAERKSEISALYKALEQYLVDNRSYPLGINTSAKEICNTGSEQVGGSTVCTNKADLRVLVPKYISSIPIDPTGGVYTVRLNPLNNSVSILSPSAELNQDISINSFTLPWAEGGNNVYTITVSGKNYRVHEFTNAGNYSLNFSTGGNVEYLIVGGGGSSGSQASMYPVPGGGGQVLSGNTSVNAQNYTVNVGNGGVYTEGSTGSAGTQSSVFGISANPGLGGGTQLTRAGDSGSGFLGGAHQGCGSGGGAGASSNGGNAIPSCANNGSGGLGGAGVQSSITGTAIGYGGGGGGASWNQGCSLGSDGGGWCGCGVMFVCGTGIVPSRGGGGGSWQSGSAGVVIVRYEI